MLPGDGVYFTSSPLGGDGDGDTEGEGVTVVSWASSASPPPGTPRKAVGGVVVETDAADDGDGPPPPPAALPDSAHVPSPPSPMRLRKFTSIRDTLTMHSFAEAKRV